VQRAAEALASTVEVHILDLPYLALEVCRDSRFVCLPTLLTRILSISGGVELSGRTGGERCRGLILHAERWSSNTKD
jgi:hypothetical protein